VSEPARALNQLRTYIDAIPLTGLALGLALWWLGWPGIANSDGEIPPLEPVQAQSVEQLEAVFSQAGYFWPARQVPPLTLKAFPDDMGEAPSEQRKALFFRALMPLVLAENERIRRQRHQLHQALSETLPEQRRKNILNRLAQRYRVDGPPLAAETWQALERRIDTVPAALALAQAAKESGWGTSRFAREANNLFGEWTWDASQGLKPLDRPEDADHYVQVFDNLRDSVRSYLQNLNSHPAYERFRRIRAQARSEARAMTPAEMTAGLENYSQRGMAYVEEVREMIRANRLHRLATNTTLARKSERVALR